MIDSEFAYHVTGSDDRDGIFTPIAFREKFPDIYVAMKNVDANFLQYGSDAEKSVIIKREPIEKFDPVQIQPSKTSNPV